jgi:surfactin synthase thioesterase subunit
VHGRAGCEPRHGYVAGAREHGSDAPLVYGGEVTGGIQKLYIFPHAGGSPQYYISFAKVFTSDVKRIAIQYPGRGGVHDLAAFTSIPALADRVIETITRLDDGRIAFFGHSMGGLLAFEVARRLEAAGNPIAALFVSACAAPGRSGYDYIPESDRGLLSVVSELTGASPEFIENEEFAAKILPTLRGFRAIIDYECPPDATLSCPIFAYLGDDDEIATYEKVAPWAERTTSNFTARVFRGHHFYINDHLTELVSDIEGKLSSLGGLPS